MSGRSQTQAPLRRRGPRRATRRLRGAHAAARPASSPPSARSSPGSPGSRSTASRSRTATGQGRGPGRRADPQGGRRGAGRRPLRRADHRGRARGRPRARRPPSCDPSSRPLGSRRARQRQGPLDRLPHLPRADPRRTSTTRCRRAATIPVARTGSGVDLLEVVQLFDRRARAALERHGDQRRRRRRRARRRAQRDPRRPRRARPRTYGPARGGDRASRGRSPRSSPARRAASRGLRGGGGRRRRGLVVAGSRVRRRDRRALPPSSARRSSCCGRSRTSCSRPRRSPTRCSRRRRRLARAHPGRSRARRRPAAVNRVLALGDELRAETVAADQARSTRCSRRRRRCSATCPTVASIKPLLGPLASWSTTVAPYAQDIRLAGEGIVSATRTRSRSARRRRATRRCASRPSSPATAPAIPTREPGRARWSTRGPMLSRATPNTRLRAARSA